MRQQARAGMMLWNRLEKNQEKIMALEKAAGRSFNYMPLSMYVNEQVSFGQIEDRVNAMMDSLQAGHSGSQRYSQAPA